MTNIDVDYKKNILSLQINPSFFEKVGYLYLEQYKLDYLANTINMNTSINNNCGLGYYDKTNKTINLDIAKIYETIKNKTYLKHVTQYSFKDMEFIYGEILTMLFHELTHVKQCDMMIGNTESFIISMYQDSKKAIQDKYLYDTFHDIYLTEHNANARGRLLSNIFMQKHNITGYNETIHNTQYILALLNNYILIDDEIISPYDQFYILNNTLQQQKQLYKNLHVGCYTSLLNGLPIKPIQYYETGILLNTDGDIIKKLKKIP